ncbi:hypothetical protein CAPTEDRAFT_218123 [Capitella teleta]|uniref:Uncharacterized protein n=1 Tax=Capitella teleta TaxID=283909 RepID=R7U7W3_CAPTE|nr:hypothetical protein CAPTEDRAFT_218123 [Capitella teleta]|eukprot:ELU02064.1 hypothetical protein CAPTEDRAFT_218123 [Capitella teleta]
MEEIVTNYHYNRDEASFKTLIEETVKKSVAEVTESLQKTVNDLKDTVSAAFRKQDEKVSDLEEQLQRAETENKNLRSKLAKVATTIAIKDTDKDVYSRKWNGIIHGIPGQAKEHEQATERKVRDMAAQNLKKSLAIEETLHRNRKKKAAKVIYSRTWPYITLKHGDGSYYHPKNCADDLVRHFYGQDINIDDIDINDML